MPEDHESPAGTTTDLAGLVDAAPDAVVVVDRAGVIVLVNRQTESLFGYQRAELVGESIEVLVPVGLRDFHARHRQRYVDQPRVRPMGTGLDLRARRRDGTEFRVEIALGPFLSHGEPMISASIRDATHKRGEERLFRALVEAAPDAMVIVDESGRILLVNGQLEELFGYQRSELEGRPVEILMPDRFVGMHVGYRSGYMANPTRRPMGIARDLVARRKDGSELPVEISLAALHRDEGMLVSAAVRDLTERRRLEASEELLRTKTEFFATVSHELRTPLASILGYGELMADNEGLPDDCRDFLEVMMRGAQRELRLVDDLLTLVHIDRAGLSIQAKAVDLVQVAHGCVGGLQPTAHGQGLSLTLDSSVRELLVHGDEQRIAQCLDNLLSNAIKFTPQGGAVVIRLGHEDALAVVEVEDTGTGVGTAERDRIFERLYRSPTAVKQQIPGAGLGLAIARAIVEAHDGSLDLVRSDESGTVLRMVLPRLR
ncbi:PAS domain S-box protein [Nocardioides dilutus]